MTSTVDFDFDQYDDIPYEEEKRQFGPGPQVLWLRGNERPPLPGRFYVKARAFGDNEPGEPWQPESPFGDETGYSTPTAKMLVIGVRRTTFVPIVRKIGGEERSVKEYKPHWKPEYKEQGGKLLTEALVLMEGLPDVAVFQAQGTNGYAFDAALKAFKAQLVAPMSRRAALVGKRGLPPFAFFLPLTAFDEKGKPVIRKFPAFNTYATPPRLDMPELDDDTLVEWAQALAAPHAMVAYAADMAVEHADWLKSNRYLDTQARFAEANGEAFPPTPFGVDDLPPDLGEAA